MIHLSAEGPIQVPATDVVSFSFDRQTDYDITKPLLLDADNTSKQLSYHGYRKIVRKLIAGLRVNGLQKGDAVFCQIGNSYLYPAIFFSIVGAGGVWMGSNPANQRYEVDHFVQLGNPKFIITEEKSLDTVLTVCKERQVPKHNVFLLDFDVLSKPDQYSSINKCAGFRPFTELLQHGEQAWHRIDNELEAKQSPAAYFPTSGTTGLPKLAMVSHWNLVAHHLIIHQETPYDVRRLISLPFFHLFATSFSFIQPTRYGHTTYVMKRFKLDNFVQNHDQYQITEAYMAPPMLIAMIQSDLDVKRLMRSVRYAGVGGAPCDAASINKMRSLLTDATMSCIWGMTEIGVSTLFRLGDHDESGSVGKLMRGMEGKLIDADGNEVGGDNEPGELYIRTEGIMLGYRNMEMAGHEKEWFRTGDVCCFEEGKLYIVGRAKELIKVKGWQVAPAEVEAVLLQHPDILDAAVCGTVSKNGIDEVPKAYVIRRKHMREADMITAEEVYQFSRTRLASYKAIEGGVCFVEEIPRTASGKIQRAKLARMDEYRRSVTDVLLSVGVSPEQREKIVELKDIAIKNAIQSPRRSARLARHQSSTSLSSTEGLSKAIGKATVASRQRSTDTSSSGSDGWSPTRVVKDARVQKQTARKPRPRNVSSKGKATA